MKSFGALLIGTPVLLIVATFFLSPILPLETYFWIPSSVYLTVVLAGLALYRHAPVTDRTALFIAVLFATAFIVCAQMLITQQAIPTRWLGWGRFPLGDAADFLSTSIPILTDGTFTTIRGRPLANAFIAGLWSGTGFDLTLLSIAITVICAFAVVQFTRVAFRVVGLGAGLLATAIAIDFLHEHIGAASTEPIGFFLGICAVALLLSGTQRRSPWIFAAGVSALALTFVYRVGPVFVLPFLLLWPLMFPCAPLGRVRTLLLCVIGILAVGALHVGVSRTLSPDSPSFVNAPKSWYAIIAMGDEFLGYRPEGSVREEARWVQIFDDHPGLHDLPIDEQGQRFIAIVGAAALERPESVLIGAGLEYADQLGRAGLFRFVDNKAIRVVVYVLFLFGLVAAAIRFRRDPLAALILLAGFGQILSIPFLHGGENRVHVGMAGMMAITAGFGLSTLGAFIRRNQLDKDFAQRPEASLGAGSLLVLPVMAIVLSSFTAFQMAGSLSDRTTELACAENEQAIAYSYGSTVTVGAPALEPIGVGFESGEAVTEAQARWRNVEAQSGAFFYAPISSAAFATNLDAASEGQASVTAFAADLTNRSARLITFSIDEADAEDGLTCVRELN